MGIPLGAHRGWCSESIPPYIGFVHVYWVYTKIDRGLDCRHIVDTNVWFLFTYIALFLFQTYIYFCIRENASAPARQLFLIQCMYGLN